MAQAVTVLKTAVSLIENDKLVNRTKELVNGVKTQVEDVKNAVERANYNKLRQEISSTSITDSVKDVVYTAEKYVGSVYDLYYYCPKTDFTKIKHAFEKGDNKPLEIFIARMDDFLRKIGKAHEEFSDACKAAKVQCDDAAEICYKLQGKEKAKKQVTAGVGAVGTVASVATGTAASVVIGIFTGGIGTVLGIVGTIAATTAVSVGTAGGTILLYREFKEAEESFRSHGRKFMDLKNSAIELKAHVMQIKSHVESYERTHQSLQYPKNHEYKSLCAAFSRLCGVSDTQSERTSKCLEEIRSFRKKL